MAMEDSAGCPPWASLPTESASPPSALQGQGVSEGGLCRSPEEAPPPGVGEMTHGSCVLQRGRH